MIKEFKQLPLEFLGKLAIDFAKEQNLNIIDGYYND